MGAAGNSDIDQMLDASHPRKQAPACDAPITATPGHIAVIAQLSWVTGTVPSHFPALHRGSARSDV